MSDDRKKYVFILTSSGKPIFSNFPNEEELVNTFSFLQAVISVVANSNDEIKSLTAGSSKIVFAFRKCLYFIIVSDFDEPESILARQLEFFYQYILFILTAKVHDLIENNPSIDLRNLLGSDADRILTLAGCNSNLTPTPVAFHALEQILVEKPLRDEINATLKDCVEKCGAAAGILMQDGMLISNQQNVNLGLSLGISDTLLLTNFVNQSQSLKSNDQNWIPICLPEFNANGYLQAYVANLVVELEKGPSQFLLVLVAQPQDLDNLIKGKNFLQKMLAIITNAQRISNMVDYHRSAVLRLREESGCLHFMYRYTSALLKGSKVAAGSETKNDAAYFVQSNSSPRIAGEGYLEKLWVTYESLALRVRKATARFEVLGQPPISQVTEVGRGRSLSLLPGAASSSSTETTSLSVGREATDPMTELTCSDHALAVSTNDGMTMLALASFGSELYVSFPSTMPLQDASRQTIRLSQTLRTMVL